MNHQIGSNYNRGALTGGVEQPDVSSSAQQMQTKTIKF